jgi:UDP-N-acetyl-D-galactosamine dehydrogenase
VKAMLKKRIHVEGARVLVMGLTFKENCPDLRNTRIVDIIAELKDYGAQVDVYDPWVNKAEAEAEYGISPIDQPDADSYDAMILAVAHREFAAMGIEQIRNMGKSAHVLYDLKYVFPAGESDLRL